MLITYATNTIQGKQKANASHIRIIVFSGGKQTWIVYTLGGKNKPSHTCPTLLCPPH